MVVWFCSDLNIIENPNAAKFFDVMQIVENGLFLNASSKEKKKKADWILRKIEDAISTSVPNTNE